MSRREALKGRVDPASAEPAPGDPGRDGDRAVNGDGQAARPARTGTAARATTGADTDGRGAAGEGRAHRTGDGPASGLSEGPVPRGTGGTPSGGGPADPEDRAGDAAGRDERMLPLDEHDKFSMRMRHAVGGFVDGPQASVEEADHVLEELAGRFTEAVTRRRRDLRTSWQSGDAGKATDTDTERLRLALRDYREMTERLLRI
ncbi:hypothetical protein [Streptomyces sp. NPDC005281]|uniref:hypothetical protein n=1 Tax=Streptomyces sp. NPDC005281 TaxID=3155712 RepID=UPI0033B24C76